jgi:glycerophosphoryl diester phosphodiesterase
MPHAILENPRPVIFAHRGGAGLFPENTLYAFEQAVALGCSVLELDLHLTRDGQLVVCHDPTLERTTNGRGAIAQLSLREVQRFDAGFHFRDLGGDTPFRGQGFTVPTFEQLLQALPDASFNVELKVGGASEVVFWRLVQKYRLEERVIVAARQQRSMDRFRALSRGQISTAATVREVLAFRGVTAAGLLPEALPFAALQIPPSAFHLQLINQTTVSAAHALGVKLHAFTIDDIGVARSLLALGVDGVMTDRPDRLLNLCRESSR